MTFRRVERDGLSPYLAPPGAGTVRPVEEARALLRTHGFRHLPGVSAEGRVLGLLSERHLLEAPAGARRR